MNKVEILLTVFSTISNLFLKKRFSCNTLPENVILRIQKLNMAQMIPNLEAFPKDMPFSEKLVYQALRDGLSNELHGLP
jgi:hypothetical protein